MIKHKNIIRNRFFRLIACGIIVSMMTSCLFFQTASCTTGGPTEHCFGITCQSCSVTDYLGQNLNLNKMYTFNGEYGDSDISPCATYIHTALDSYGYDNQSAFNDNPAVCYRDVLGSDAIFFANGHGGPGRMLCVTSDSSHPAATFLTATNLNNYSTCYSIYDKYKSSSLIGVRFACFCGCETALTDTQSGLGNLIDTCCVLGVQCSMAFSTSIYYDKSDYYTDFMINKYCLQEGLTVKEAAHDAIDDVKAAFYGDTGGCDNYVIRGCKGTDGDYGYIKLVPAGYGYQG